MPNSTEIKSSKIFVGEVFQMWFRIPEYQRPYVWGDEEIDDLLEDLTYAAVNKPDDEYFLGSFVYQARPADPSRGMQYAENDLLDGQQRLTTMLLLFAVMRDLSVGDDKASKGVRTNCQDCVYQEANEHRKIPERMRLSYHVRPEVERFLDEYVKPEGGSIRHDGHYRFEQFVATAEDASVRNIAKAIEKIEAYLTDGQMMPLGSFLTFLLNRVLMIYVSTENMEDAFRLFTILNNRGVPLRSSDILKTTNLGQIKNEAERRRFAQMWEGAEGELQDDFDRFLNYLRTILVKDKARLNLLQEFEERIYDPKEKDKSTGQVKPRLLERGKPTFEFVERHLRNYRTLLLSGDNQQTLGSFEFDNLVGVMQAGLPSTDWIPPLLRFYDRFGTKNLVEFLHAVNRKFGGDWIGQQTPSDRIAAMNTVIGEVERCTDSTALLASNVFAFDHGRFRAELAGDIYHRRFARYVMLMLDFLYSNQSLQMQFNTLSVEHILPQNPAETSQWLKDFTETERREWTHRMGNLVLITRRKNTSQGRLDYAEKKQRYFQKNIDTCPNSLRVLNGYSSWTPADLMNNHKTSWTKLLEYFKVSPTA